MNLFTLLSVVAGATASGAPDAPAALAAQPAPVTGRVVLVGGLPEGVSGSAMLKGDKPETKPLEIDPKASEGCTKDGAAVDATNQELIVSKDGGVANVVVTVEVADAKIEAPKEEFHMDQAGCRFEPHVKVLPVGSSLVFLNSDEVSHNVHTYPKRNPAMNKTVAPGSKETQKLDKADEIEVKCDIHPWMKSYVIVVDTPYFAVSDANGKFQLDGLPEGEHKVEYWHETLGKGKGTVKVGADGKAEPLALELSAEKKGGGRRR
jgi:plastocyanin